MSPFFNILFPFILDSFWKANVCMCCLFISHFSMQEKAAIKAQSVLNNVEEGTNYNRKVNTDMNFIMRKIKRGYMQKVFSLIKTSFIFISLQNQKQ